MNKKAIIFIILIVTLSVFLYIKFVKHNNFMYAGTIEVKEVDISSRLIGVISNILVDEGDKIKPDQVLVKLSVEDIEVAAKAAERDYLRANELLTAGSMNQEAFDRVKFRKDDTSVRLSWATVKSPIEGTVITRYHEPGEMVNPGTKLMTVADLKNPWAYFYVEQPVLSRISIGMKIYGFVPEADMKKIPGRIVHINNEAEFTPKNVQTRKERTRLIFGIKIAFENNDEFLKPGMTVEVKLPEK